MGRETDELIHSIMHVAQLQAGVHLPVLYAHVSDYDQSFNRVRVMIPAWGDGTGAPLLTGWIPLQSPMVGNKAGFQYCMKGGASFTNPTAGELVELLVMDESNGAYIAASPVYTTKMVPPAVILPDTMNPGELLVAHESGTFIYMQQGGGLQFQSSKLAFFGGTVVAQPSIQGTLTDNTGGVASVIMAAIAGTPTSYAADAVIIRAWIAQIVLSLNALTQALSTGKLNLVTHP